jgi:hypothetical protein
MYVKTNVRNISRKKDLRRNTMPMRIAQTTIRFRKAKIRSQCGGSSEWV